MAQPYPTPRPHGRGPQGALLPHRRRLRSSQPPCPLLRIHKAPLGLGSHRPRPLPAAARRGKRTLESERSFLRDAERFFCHLFPGVVGLHPSSFHRRVRKLRRFLEPLRRDIPYEMIGNPQTLVVDSTLLSVLHPLLRSLRARDSPGRRG